MTKCLLPGLAILESVWHILAMLFILRAKSLPASERTIFHREERDCKVSAYCELRSIATEAMPIRKQFWYRDCMLGEGGVGAA